MQSEPKRSGNVIVGECYLEVRAKLLEVAATFDRIDRASGAESLDADATKKHLQLKEAVEILLSDGGNRAEQLQHLFSRTYEEDWRKKMSV